MSNYFVKNVPGLSNPDLCPSATTTFGLEQLQKPFINGIATISLIADPETNRIPVAKLSEYVTSLEISGVVPAHKPKPSRNGSLETDIDKLVEEDTKFFGLVKDEYCYYETRYKYALRRFLELSTTLDNSTNDAARQMLNISTQLNQKLNNLLEVVAFITESRVKYINNNTTAINESNMRINNRLKELKSQHNLLTRDNAQTETQKEMVKYTKEKNEYAFNQITVFAVLNIFAVSAMYAVYKASAGQ
jgi:hypothetical protein